MSGKITNEKQPLIASAGKLIDCVATNNLLTSSTDAQKVE